MGDSRDAAEKDGKLWKVYSSVHRYLQAATHNSELSEPLEHGYVKLLRTVRQSISKSSLSEGWLADNGKRTRKKSLNELHRDDN